MRVVLFASGSQYSRVVMDALAERGFLAGVVTPAARGPWPLRWRRQLRIWRALRPLRRTVRERGAKLLSFSAATKAFIARLSSLDPDVLVIAAFPYLVRQRVLDVARHGALNVHPSLLPRHRGSDPLFWTFYCDDRITGSTVHRVTEAVDAGNIMRQESLPVRRGMTSHELEQELARLGAALTLRTIEDLMSNRPTGVPQDESLASTESHPSAGGWEIDFQHWPAERLWHFLRGVGVSHAPLLRRALPVGEVIDYTVAVPEGLPGTLEARGDAVRIYVGDGWVTARALR